MELLVNINRIAHTNNQLTFKSKNCPIEPFVIQTKLGPLKVEELSKKELKKASDFNFHINLEVFPDWQQSYNIANAEQRNYWMQLNEKKHAYILNKGGDNSTILVAKDAENNFKAFFSLVKFDEFKDSKVIDVTTGHLDECLIDAKYRGQGIGKIILDKLLTTADGHFTDVVAESFNKALGFYKRAGFKELDPSNPAIKKISDFILSGRQDRDLITLISKPIDASNPWWKRVAKQIK